MSRLTAQQIGADGYDYESGPGARCTDPERAAQGTLRLYGPKARALSGTYVYPPIKLVG